MDIQFSVSAMFKASGLLWYEAGLMSGAILAFLCAARGIAKAVLCQHKLREQF